jgi:hypothetical protein
MMDPLRLLASFSHWLAAQMRSPQEPGFWVGLSLLAAVLGANLAWALARLRFTRSPFERARRFPATPAIVWLVVSLFLLLPPLAAWKAGAISMHDMGLTELDWLAGLGMGGLLAVLLLALVLVGWLLYRRAGPNGAGVVAASAGERWRAPLDAALLQWHWAFYRAAAIGWLAAAAQAAPLAAATDGLPARLVGALLAQPLYWGSWLGLALVGLEWVLMPQTYRSLRTPGQFEGVVRGVGLAVATTALFILTRNFWLCLVCHALAETAIAAWWPATA